MELPQLDVAWFMSQFFWTLSSLLIIYIFNVILFKITRTEQINNEHIAKMVKKEILSLENRCNQMNEFIDHQNHILEESFNYKKNKLISVYEQKIEADIKEIDEYINNKDTELSNMMDMI